MTAITTITNASRFKLLETIAVTNLAADSTVHKAIEVPGWAHYATIVIADLTLAGTTPLFDFVLYGADVAVTNPPDTDALYDLGGWDGITQKTAAAGTNTVIDIGPTYTADDSGSATASDRYAVQAALPYWLVYKYILNASVSVDEDYSGTISIYFRSAP